MPAVTVNSRHQAGGFSLLEVLITMLVVALALLGHITLQNRTISEQQAAFFQGMADTYLNDIAERMAANAEEATMAVTRDPATNTASVANAATSYNNSNNNAFRNIDPAAPAPSTDCSGASSCNRATLAAYDLAIWQRNVGAVMPGAAFRIRNVGGADQPGLVEIILAWTPNKDGEVVDLSTGCDVDSSSFSVQCRVLVKML